ncbi:MAG: DsbA family protein [Pseudomonadota bacterium]|nr:DsbA family protein [Pseudomonadota bacterium]
MRRLTTLATTLITGLALALTLAACQKATTTAVTAEDMSMGNAKAPVTMVEYASVSCPHCADWNKEVFPAFKAKYIDTGKVRYVLREALTSDPAIAAAGFLTARCAGKDKYFQVVDAIYRAQQEMFTGGQPHAVLLRIARSAGLTDAQFEACIKDETALNALNTRWEHYVKDDHINATPTFVINGKTYDKGGTTLADMDGAIAEAMAGAKSS